LPDYFAAGINGDGRGCGKSEGVDREGHQFHGGPRRPPPPQRHQNGRPIL